MAGNSRVKIISLDVLKQKVSVKEELNEAPFASTSKIILQKPVVICKKPSVKEAEPTPTRNIITISRRTYSERMEQFLKMKASDLPKPKKKEYACEKQLETPRDTLRCPACRVLYDRANHQQHKKECKRKSGHKYGCVLCAFTHTDIKELQKHIINCRKQKTQKV